MSIIAAHKWSPTNMAGFGWDVVVHVLAIIISIALLATSIKRTAAKGISAKVLVYINLLGLASIILFFFFR
jgi:hypothetical protein